MKNIKLIIAAVALMMVHSASYAVELDLGLDFAVSGSNFKIKDDKSAIENNIGYALGGSAKIDLGKFSAGPELWYTRNTATLSGYYSDTNAKIKSNSLDLPVLASMRFLQVIDVEAGPSFSLLSRAKVEVGDETYDIGRIKPNVGYVVGARLTILKVLVVGARFNGTFGSEEVAFGDDVRELRTNSYTISVGAKF